MYILHAPVNETVIGSNDGSSPVLHQTIIQNWRLRFMNLP